MFNQLQYEVALFNFEIFLLRDFELHRQTTADGQWALEVGPFDAKTEAEWWIGLMQKNPTLETFIRGNGIVPQTK